MNQWIDLSIVDAALNLLDDDLLQVFGVDPVYVQFTLVFLFVMVVMWVVRPLIEWMMLQNWNTFASYITSVLLTLVFLQVVDRYAMVQSQSLLPDYYWSVCLLGISGYGVAHILFKISLRTWNRITKRSKKHVA